MQRDHGFLLDILNAAETAIKFCKDTDQVWNTVQQDLPQLVQYIKPLISIE